MCSKDKELFSGISKDPSYDKIYAALKACYDELLSFHLRFGDTENALKHNNALRLANKALNK